MSDRMKYRGLKIIFAVTLVLMTIIIINNVDEASAQTKSFERSEERVKSIQAASERYFTSIMHSNHSDGTPLVGFNITNIEEVSRNEAKIKVVLTYGDGLGDTPETEYRLRLSSGQYEVQQQINVFKLDARTNSFSNDVISTPGNPSANSYSVQTQKN
ncbi:hypothetical protein [Paenibacillus aquistagni]|uniref:Uncharacterized protein n=1 Tax=Paenibacillus aquistagni TaxID=1852522 RepID=A0A1X7LNA0_9BACL|nr:hypothetical protein [Paenibacillus aquistagni]SMG55356.1 hypothetical protein SAMN06295960_3883 [Paenibacillus aquistagni]